MNQNELAQLYSNYCAIYGDLMLKKEQIEKELFAIRSKINSLQSNITTENTNEQTTSTTKTS